ncbi:MAG: radical SAM protein [Candidatus Eremiobacteraeota bacterium]|nr:radical SAM protein [Candidatus Eremiobacteraeota bacterium]MBC5802558.1 radical SAM protein [Candidatus Eremiobacteraeota bacterium]MBC5821919.1 radical SAM protein [Candidatus Eremiobacteraeota bacterium]
MPFADGGRLRVPRPDELIAAPPGTIPTVLPRRTPLLVGGHAARNRVALGALLPAGYTRLLLPAYRRQSDAPALPLFGYTFACVVADELHVAAMRTDASDDWTPRTFAPSELESYVASRRARDPSNAVLAQLAVCATTYGCFTAQNVFLERGEAALPVSPRCNARCIGCISEQDADAGFPSPQARVRDEADVDALARIALAHLERVPDGIVSFGQGCEGEPLLRVTTIARAIERIRAQTPAGTINLNTNGSLPKSLAVLIDAGLDAVRISLNSFRTDVYATYYRPLGYGLADVFESVRHAVDCGLRVSLNLLTHPGVTDDAREVAACDDFLSAVRVAMVQTRTLNIDPQRYFAAVGRPSQPPLGMREALRRIGAAGVRLGNFTHAH